jgi:hypothetical protein
LQALDKARIATKRAAKDIEATAMTTFGCDPLFDGMTAEFPLPAPRFISA